MEAAAEASAAPANTLYTVLVVRFKSTKVLLAAVTTPTEEPTAVKFVLVDTMRAVPLGLPLVPKVTDTELVNIWNEATVGTAAKVLVEAATVML